MHQLIKRLLALAILFLVLVPVAGLAQVGGGVGAQSFFKLTGNVLTLIKNTWQLGDASNRISKIYVNQLDASSVAFSGAVSGDLTVTGDAYANKFVASSTNIGFISAGSGAFSSINVTGTGAFGGITSTNSTSTNSTSTYMSVLNTLYLPDGSAANPSLTWLNDPDTGLHRISANQIGISAGGSDIMSVNTTSVRATVPFFIKAENDAATPDLTTANDLDTGFYWVGDGQWAFVSNGAVQMWFRGDKLVSYRDWIPTTHNSLKLGNFGAAFSDVVASGTYYGGNLQVSNATATNLVVTTGNLTVTNGVTSLQQTELGPLQNRAGNALDIAAVGGQMLTLNGEGGTWLGGNYNGSTVGVIFYDDQYPQTDDTYDSGTTTARWKSVNTVTMTASNVSSTNATTTNLTIKSGGSIMPTTDGGVNMGSGSKQMGGVFAQLFDGDEGVFGTVDVTSVDTPAGTTGNQTIEAQAFSVNFAAGTSTLVVTNPLVSSSLFPVCTVNTNDTTMKYVVAVPTANTLTLYANANATAETRVSCFIAR